MKTGKKKKSAPKTAEKKPLPKEPIERDEQENERPDFGGLPDRDLKKNLGCG